ncbi:MAG TPA: hypothetical protein PLA77_06565, partial [Bacteroidales bacterium]|nr:hypothetical protein [Bacteroidales bacterium]
MYFLTNTNKNLSKCCYAPAGNLYFRMDGRVSFCSSGNSDVTAYYPFSQSIPLGSTVNYSNEIINANNLMLNEGCYLIIDSIS